MSSHREAPEISKDPVADSTDVYAFVSPDRPDTVTIIANYVPLQDPASGPNFFEFGDDVEYKIHIAPTLGDSRDEITYSFRFSTRVPNPNTFLYITGPVTSLDSPSYNRPQTYSVTRRSRQRNRTQATGLKVPPCNVGPRSTPDYVGLAEDAYYDLPDGGRVFAGQRADPFWVDLGSVFDLGALRPFQNLHLLPMGAMSGINTLSQVNVHSIVLQLPISSVTRNRDNPSDPMDHDSTIGVWTSASRAKNRTFDEKLDRYVSTGPMAQVSRMANPLFNEVLVPMSRKDSFNNSTPWGDSQFAGGVARPELAGLLPVLYPGVFPNLQGYTKERADLLAILLTGIPGGVVPGFQNYTGPTQADMLRLNVAIPPATDPNPLGIVGGDLAGFPNGRRLTDDVVTIELRAIAGATIPLVDPSFTPDGAAALVTDGSTPTPVLDGFPYVNVPYSGFDVPAA
ncbi:DUF4331 domain-containing protein [Aquipuribacter hungaricus]|uniref:DUF4331 domain-containing protein n=1 Tax=Aquipuribacter hungaricus TaxID=545624 RepID=A0ABV7WGF5_9MICO